MQLRSDGRWVSGPADLLSVVRRERDELIHSRAIAWLLNPVGRHGFGDRYLRSVLRSLWPDDEFDFDSLVTLSLEEKAMGLDEAETELLEARADIVLRFAGHTIVLENKLDAGEGSRQCERLYWAFQAEPAVVRYAFITPRGVLPSTAVSPAAKAAWRALSYPQILALLDQALGEAQSVEPSHLGRASAAQYAATLRRRFDDGT